jgi:hypothetical protein
MVTDFVSGGMDGLAEFGETENIDAALEERGGHLILSEDSENFGGGRTRSVVECQGDGFVAGCTFPH